VNLLAEGRLSLAVGAASGWPVRGLLQNGADPWCFSDMIAQWSMKLPQGCVTTA
jgi:hypothetical protein